MKSENAAVGTLFITGRSGHVGNFIFENFSRAGWSCIEIDHTKDYKKYSIPLEHKDWVPNNRKVLFHVGQPKAPRSYRQRLNYLDATSELFKLAHNISAELVFVSSLSAFPTNRSHYSQDKLYLEKLATSLGGKVVKLGLFPSDSRHTPLHKITSTYKIFCSVGLSRLFPVDSYRVTPPIELASYLNRIFENKSIESTEYLCGLSLTSTLGTIPESNLQSGYNLLSSVAKSLVGFLSKMGSGRADALLVVLNGMSIENRGHE